jgi:nucleoid-associated protein YgaU
MEGRREAMERRRASAKVKKHVVGPGDTLSGLAKKYYGDEGTEKWMKIYEANKEVIGDNPDLIIDGTELVIPDLDD